MADSKRIEAAFTWVAEFYGPLIDLPMGEKPENFWKEHILSLAYLCKTKVAAPRHANSPLDAFSEAKTILQSLDERHGNMNRWQELDAAAAARGCTTAIYKFIVLFFHYVSSYLEEYMTESEALMAKNDFHQPFADLLSDVNSSTDQWWQGVSRPPESPVAHKLDSAENSPFGKYSSNNVRTPRTPFIRRDNVAPLSPIQTAINSPITLKVKRDEYQRMRTSLAETEHLLDEERMKVNAAMKEAERYKSQVREWRDKYEQTEDQRETYYRQVMEMEDTIEKLHHLNEKAVIDGREIKSRFDKQEASLQEVEAERLKWQREKERQVVLRADLERALRDLKEEMHALEKKHWSLEAQYQQAEKNNEALSNEVQEKMAEIDNIRAANRHAAHKKDLEVEEFIASDGEMRRQLRQALMETEEVTTKLRDKEIELDEAKSSYNRDLAAAQEAASSQSQELLERIKTLKGLLDETNGLLAAKEIRLRELQEMTLIVTRDVEKYNWELSQLRRELHAAQSVNRDLQQKIGDKSHQLQQTNTRMDELEKQFLLFKEEPRVEEDSRPKTVREDVPEPEVKSSREQPDHDVSSVLPEPNLAIAPSINGRQEGFNHLYDEGNEDDDNQSAVVEGKTLGGGEYERLFQDTTRDFAQEVDKPRIEELNARNSRVGPAHRCAYALETHNYDSPTGSSTEARMKAPPVQPNVAFTVPFVPADRLSKASSKTSLDVDKENMTGSFTGSAKKPPRSSRRKSIVSDFFGSLRGKK